MASRTTPQERALFAVLLLFPAHLFFQHDLQDGLVGVDHAIVTESPHILNGFVRRVADDAVGVLDIDPMQGKECGLDRGTCCSVEFNGTTGFCAIADHSGQVLQNIFNCPFHMVHVAADQIGDAGCRPGPGSDGTAADGREPAGMGLDIGGDNMAQSDRP